MRRLSGHQLSRWPSWSCGWLFCCQPDNAFSRPELRHDVGKMVFAFSVFWIYLGFAQYIVIWYGDIPVETFFILVRFWHYPWALDFLDSGLLHVGVPFHLPDGRQAEEIAPDSRRGLDAWA